MNGAGLVPSNCIEYAEKFHDFLKAGKSSVDKIQKLEFTLRG
jgi:hypothetical protein